MSVVAIIPAKGTSRRVVGKNMRALAGSPLLLWTIRAAQATKSLDRIVVSSDDDTILEYARLAGVETLARPASLALDATPDHPVAVHAIRTLKLDPDDCLVWLRPTAPFRTGWEIDEVVGLLERRHEASSIRSVIPALCHPRKCFVDAGFQYLGYTALVPYTPNPAPNHPTQSLERVFQPVGFIDAVRACWPLRGTMNGALVAAWDAPPDRAVDIDDAHDFEVADALARAMGWQPGEVTA